MRKRKLNSLLKSFTFLILVTKNSVFPRGNLVHPNILRFMFAELYNSMFVIKEDASFALVFFISTMQCNLAKS